MHKPFYYHALRWCTLSTLLVAACSREKSFQIPENKGVGAELASSGGLCTGGVVQGVFGQGLALDSSNKLVLQVQIPSAGSYSIQSDTVSGVWFRGSFTASGSGAALIQVPGFGTPSAGGLFNFTLRSGQSSCRQSVTVLTLAVGKGNSFFPMTAGSWWTYQSSDPLASPSDTFRQTATAVTRQFIATGPGYTEFLERYTPTFTDTSFYRQTRPDFATYADMDIAGAGDAPVPADYIFLRENGTLAAEWQSGEATSTVGGTAVKFRLKYKIIERDSTAFVGGMIFRPTIKVRVTQQVQLTPLANFTDLLSYEAWYARGIGLINIAAPAPYYGYRLQAFKVN